MPFSSHQKRHLPCGVQTLDVLQHQGSHPAGQLPLRNLSPKCPLSPSLSRLFSSHCAPTFINSFSPPSSKLHNPCLQQPPPLDPTQPRGAHSRYSLFVGWFRPCPFILTFSQGGLACTMELGEILTRGLDSPRNQAHPVQGAKGLCTHSLLSLFHHPITAPSPNRP